MPDLSTAQAEALARGHVMQRKFIWCDALNPETGQPDPAGFWNDVGVVTVGGSVYHGSGTLIQLAKLSATADLSVPGMKITLSGLSPEVSALVRGSTVGQRPIEVHIGIFDTANESLIPPLIPVFRGFVDDIDIRTPEVGGESTILLTCESQSRALTMRRTATRSDATAQERDDQDGFYRYTGLQHGRRVWFGQATPGRQGSGREDAIRQILRFGR